MISLARYNLQTSHSICCVIAVFSYIFTRFIAAPALVCTSYYTRDGLHRELVCDAPRMRESTAQKKPHQSALRSGDFQLFERNVLVALIMG